MNDIHSKEFQNKYKKSKYKVKQWEDKFLAENGRFPTKADIKSSPVSVKEYYKLYWKLKTQILEAEILGDIKLLDTVPVKKVKSDTVLKEYTNTVETTKNDPSKEQEEKESAKDDCDINSPSTSKENINNSNTWGAHLNKAKPSAPPEKEKCGLITEAVAGRLFKGSSFKKRNPRKALSFTKKKSNKSEESCKSFDSGDMSSIMSPFSDISQDVSFTADQSLNESVFSVENDISPNIKALITASASLSPLLNKSVEVKGGQPTQPINLVQVAANDPTFFTKSVRKVDPGWVERCNESVNKEERKSSSDSGFDSMEGSLQECRDEESKVDDSSDDDIIAGSDTEQDDKSIFLSQKRKLEVSPTPVEEKKSPKYSPEVEHVSKKLKIETLAPGKEEVKKTILERKMAAGTLNENYVKINLKKKVFVRGKKNFNFGKFKKQEWKKKKKGLMDDGRESGGLVQCYKCGETGHFSRYCQKVVEDKLLDGEEEEEESLPTLEEAEKMAKETAEEKKFKKRNVLFVEKPVEDSSLLPKVEPLYKLTDNGSTISAPQEVYEALDKFGHFEFRPGQEEAIMRILSGQSTLLTLATGGGKSLCYQLPAYLYAQRSKCITLVVSPLVSLMEDQVAGSSSFFKVGCLHTSQTPKQRKTVLDDAKSGKLYALLVSPEAVVSGDTFGSIFQQLPPIAFACIDEAHCLSQWSHNFRPSYLMISKVLREKLGITTILGLTATATLSTIESITQELGIQDIKGVIRDIPIPDNLVLSVSREDNKDQALLQLLKSDRFKDAKAILIYCTRRDECERLAVLIRTVLQSSLQEEKKISKRLSWNAESYHAGMAVARRKQVQKAFMCGNLRIVVATVAFGMGINKQDIRGVIHYNMPKDFESYVQEVGRAGRDGKVAYCHLFLNSKGRDLNELRRHIHANSVDRHVLRKLLQRVFIECNCKTEKCQGHEVAFDCSDTIQALDIPEENIYTLLYYLELHSKKFIKVLSPVYVNCKIRSYKGRKAITSAAKKCPPLAYACATCSNWQKEKSDVLEFNVVELANKIGWDSSLVKSQLKSVEWEVIPESKNKKTGIMVEFSGLGFRVCSRGDLTPSEQDEALDYLTQRVEEQEKRSISLLDINFSTFDHFACDRHDGYDSERGETLKSAVRKYFETETICEDVPVRKLETEEFNEDEIAADVRVLLCTYRDNTFNGRAVARIFHGIQSPNYPASIWFKCRFWRKHIDKDFKKISRIATREILRLK